MASGQGFEDRLEGVCALESCGVDGCSHVGLGLRGPHGAVAVGHFPLDHAVSQLSLRAIVGGFDLAGIVAKGQKLVSRAPNLGLQLSGEVASGRRRQKGFELPFELSLLPREG